MEVLQLIIILVGLYGVIKVIKNKFNNKKKAIWFLIWGLMILAGFIPELTSKAASIFGVTRGADIILYLGFLLLFYLVFLLFTKIDELNSQITKIVRTIALNEK